MTDSETVPPVLHDKSDPHPLVPKLAALKRLLSAAGREVQIINEQGRAALSDASQIGRFKAMFGDLKSHYQKFQDVWEQIIEGQEVIGKGSEFPTAAYNDKKDAVRRYYYEAVETASRLSINHAAAGNTSFASTTDLRNSTYLPKVQLPSFNGQLSQWPKFRDAFKSMVHDEPLVPDITKFHYLIGSLKGTALTTIRHLPISSANYSVAWKVLIETYDNKRLLASTYVTALLDHPTSSGKPTATSLGDFLVRVTENIEAFRLLQLENELDFILYYLAARGLDNTSREKFETSVPSTSFPSYKDLLNWVRSRCDAMQLMEVTNCYSAARPSKPGISKGKLSVTAINVQESSQASVETDLHKCPACGRPHRLWTCHQFRKASYAQRMTMLKEWNGCQNCLSPKHPTSDCKSQWRCKECSQRHHSMLHEPVKSADSINLPSPPNTVELSCVSPGTYCGVLLGTAQAEFQRPDGTSCRLRMVIDSGSQNSLITEHGARKLGLTFEQTNRTICGVSGATPEKVRGIVECKLHPVGKTRPVFITRALVLTSITPSLPTFNVPEEIKTACREFPLADPTFATPGPIDFLLGSDLYPDIGLTPFRQLTPQGPHLISSAFGHIILGRVPDRIMNKLTHSLLATENDALADQLQRFWAIEEPSGLTKLSSEEEPCEAHFKSSHSRSTEGRYTVRLPFSRDPPTLEETERLAKKRFFSNEARFAKNPILKDRYSAFMEEYLELKHMSPTDDCSSAVLPHHAVCGSEKIRVVFDGSAKTKIGSLNDYLLVGPKLQQDLRAVLQNFRLHTYVLTCDIVKMFRQVLIDPRDRKYQHIYWRSDATRQLQKFELNTVTYGLACSPYLAQRVILQLAEDEGSDLPLAARVLKEDIYVDDIISGADTLEEAMHLKKELISLLQRGGFTLGKWSSNNPDLLKEDSDLDSSSKALLDSKEGVKILGLRWSPTEDQFLYSVLPLSTSSTKRGILSTIARLFDPLGFLSPVILKAKLMVQQLWKDGTDWDSSPEIDVQERWKCLRDQLPLLTEIRISRLIYSPEATSLRIIGFCDASNDAYGAALYARVVVNGGVRIRLLTSKTKVAPIRTISVPRLELCGALLLTRLFNSLHHFRTRLTIPEETPICFSDSTIVLNWLAISPSDLKVFVANRVSEIISTLPARHWRHVPSEENPADCASRGLLPSELVKHPIWWEGPPWLKTSEDNWPNLTLDQDKSAIQEEVKSRKAIALTATVGSTDSPSWINRFSSWEKLLRVTSWILRVRDIIQKRDHKRTGPLTPSEIDAAEKALIKRVQQAHFPWDGSQASTPKQLTQLHPYYDEEGILRVGGRLNLAPVHRSVKHPIILPTKNHLTNLVLDHLHKVHLHPGPTQLQALCQLRYWIPSLRRLARKRTFLCVTCYKASAKRRTLQPVMGNLPPCRLIGQKAFLNTGIDYAGPFKLRLNPTRKSATSKAYLALFICMATKAVHLEMVTCLSTDAFIAAFNRFTARRGLPRNVYSDCGTNFVGASSRLKELAEWVNEPSVHSTILDFASQRKIDWHFNPPSAPNFGGLWEAAIKSAKTILYKKVLDMALTYEEWSTILCLVEAQINSRPLCALSSHPEENDFLSPGHFLIGTHLTTPPEKSVEDLPRNRLSRWQMVQQITEQFWRRWSQEYLSYLLPRKKWTRDAPNLKEGDLVFIRKDTVAPLHWPRGRVLKVHPGADKVVRVVTLRTPQTELRRPVSALVPLPICEADDIHEDPGKSS